MKYHSKKILLSVLSGRKGLSLLEVMAAVMILALVTSSVLVVVSRCISSAADSALRMQAFEVARDNMEKLLALDSVHEMAEYGNSERYPDIQWETVVEPFYEPVTSRMWVQAICSAEYTDSAGEVQTLELTHWLTNLTKQQLLEIMDEKQKEKERLAEADQIVQTAQEAAEYAGVEAETILQWAKSGDMPMTEDGEYIKLYLDLYQEYDGEPPPDAQEEAAEAYAVLTGTWRVGGLGNVPLAAAPKGPLPAGPKGTASPGGQGSTASTGPKGSVPTGSRGPQGTSGTQPSSAPRGSHVPSLTLWREFGLSEAMYYEFFPEARGR